jgi:hypothetical protein
LIGVTLPCSSTVKRGPLALSRALSVLVCVEAGFFDAPVVAREVAVAGEVFTLDESAGAAGCVGLVSTV